jgi:UDP-N-acetylmuramoyl-tripeptide--D-alanyl-D-alanine ligase
MIPLELELIEPLGRLTARPWADEVTGVQIDSRRIEEGDLFVAAGEGGRDFVAHALARGAAAALVPGEPHRALAAIAGVVRDRSAARFVGITGATGKTTTKDILAALCAPHRRTVASEGNYNNELGVPLTICRVEPDTELCIVEMGMRGLDQIAWLASIARPEIGLITNIAPVHLELVETVENVAKAKAELIEALPQGGTAVVPEEPLLDPYLTRTDIEIRRFGHVEEPGRFRVGNRTVVLETSYGALHQLDNTLAALTVCDVLGIPLAGGRLDVTFSQLREEVVELPGGVTAIVDCYNANPISMRAALDHLARLAGGRRQVAVLGEMAELGAGAAAFHREVGAEVARNRVAALVAVGPLAREYKTPGVEAILVANAEEAAEAAQELLRPGDVVLIKGSRAVGLEAVAAKLQLLPRETGAEGRARSEGK